MDNEHSMASRRNRRLAGVVGLLLAGGIGGGAVAATSSASIPLALAGAAAQGRFKRGDRVVVAAFGAGATWGAVAWEWDAV